MQTVTIRKWEWLYYMPDKIDVKIRDFLETKTDVS